MASTFLHFARTAFSTPKFLSMSAVGIDISASGVKGAVVAMRAQGLELLDFIDVRLASTVIADGDIVEREPIIRALQEVRKKLGVSIANVALPESKSYLFETHASGITKEALKLSVEQHIDEYVPLSPADTAFDIVPVGHDSEGTQVVGVGYARRIVNGILSVCEEAGFTIRALESETFAISRAVLPFGGHSTVLIIDIGKTTTKIIIVAEGVPRFATTVGIGGHSLTLAVQKHFGVTEAEARRVKLSRGIVPGEGNEDYLAAMLSTASAIRDEIITRLEYWQGRAELSGGREPVSRAVLVGGNASVRGLAEYLEGSLRIPVTIGNVFANFASTEEWLPPLDYTQSLVFPTAIGLALREYAP